MEASRRQNEWRRFAEEGKHGRNIFLGDTADNIPRADSSPGRFLTLDPGLAFGPRARARVGRGWKRELRSLFLGSFDFFKGISVQTRRRMSSFFLRFSCIFLRFPSLSFQCWFLFSDFYCYFLSSVVIFYSFLPRSLSFHLALTRIRLSPRDNICSLIPLVMRIFPSFSLKLLSSFFSTNPRCAPPCPPAEMARKDRIVCTVNNCSFFCFFSSLHLCFRFRITQNNNIFIRLTFGLKFRKCTLR